MKKNIFFIILLFFIPMIFINANATILDDWNYNNKNIYQIFDMSVFNYIAGCPEDKLINTNFYYYADECSITYGIEKGGQYWHGTIEAVNDPTICEDIYIEYQGMNSVFFSALVKFGDEIIYYTETTLSDDPHNIICKEIDLNEYFNTKNLIFTAYIDKHIYELEDTVFKNNVTSCLYDGSDFGLSCLIGTIINENKIYEGHDLYFVTNVVSPLKEKDILDSLIIYDYTEGDISSNAIIVSSNYKLEEDKIDIGKYKLKIMVKDNSGNITFQDAYVLVTDINPPEIISNDVLTPYYKEIKNLIDLFEIKDDSSDFDYEIILDEYTLNKNKPGEYIVSLKATDKALNSTIKSIKITVYDDVAPYFILKDAIASSTHPINDINELLEYVSAKDVIDGKDLIIDIEDTDLYFNNPTKVGFYNFKITAKDKSNNIASSTLKLEIYDDDYPEIYAPKYTISVGKDQELTKEDISLILLQSGRIESLDDLILTSSYFETPNITGDYDLIISTKNGIYKDTINVKDNDLENELDENISNQIDYSIPLKEENNNSYIYIIISGISIIIIISLGIVFYRRKH